MQAHRILNKKGPSLKAETTHKNSPWRGTTAIIAEFRLTEENLHISKQGPSKALDALSRESTYQEIRNEAISKTKLRHWMENQSTLKRQQRPQYMIKLSRKHYNAIIRTRDSMLPVKANQKTKVKDDLTCSLCGKHNEDQTRVLTECSENPAKIELPYEDLFKDGVWERLNEAMEKSILISDQLEAIR